MRSSAHKRLDRVEQARHQQIERQRMQAQQNQATSDSFVTMFSDLVDRVGDTGPGPGASQIERLAYEFISDPAATVERMKALAHQIIESYSPDMRARYAQWSASKI